MRIDFNTLVSQLPVSGVLEILSVEAQQQGSSIKAPCFKDGCGGSISFTTRGAKQGLGFCVKHRGGCNILQYANNLRKSETLRETAEWLNGEFLNLKKTSPNQEFNREIPLGWHNSMLEYCDQELAKEMEVGLVTGKSILSGHIAFAVHDPDGIKLGYVGKNLKTKEWKTPAKLDTSVLLYNMHRVTWSDEVFITREIETAIKYWQYGLPIVAAFGQNFLTGNQVDLIRRFKKLTFFRHDKDFLDNITYQAVCLMGNYWRVQTHPPEERIKDLL